MTKKRADKRVEKATDFKSEIDKDVHAVNEKIVKLQVKVGEFFGNLAKEAAEHGLQDGTVYTSTL